MADLPDHAAVRAAFPALQRDLVFLDNAGGSQVPHFVVDRMRRYLAETYVQLGADYALSQECSATVDTARRFLLRLVGGEGLGEVVLGPSTSVLCHHLASAFAATPPGPRNRILVCEGGHEANMGPWLRLARHGYEIDLWRVDPDTTEFDLDALDRLLDERTAVVAMHHVSNILGRIEPIAGICRRARAVGARTVIDGVAFAPHRAVDVAALDCDFYVFSTYKVYGPHMAVLFGRHESWGGLVGPNHFFVPDDAVPYKWELGGPNHEGCAGVLGTADFLRYVAGTANGEAPPALPDRKTIHRAFERMAAWEAPLQDRLLAFLRDHPDYRIVGPDGANPDDARSRVATVSFTYKERTSRDVAVSLNAQNLAVRYGHFYAYQLIEQLGLAPDDGVIRASFVHYNTLDEVDRLIAALE